MCLLNLAVSSKSGLVVEPSTTNPKSGLFESHDLSLVDGCFVSLRYSPREGLLLVALDRTRNTQWQRLNMESGRNTRFRLWSE